ncbi:MAG: hypothetical protein U5K53_08630 [Halanaerobiales bacterium]|nr:hypothetical protein [Halanaerobiales bacterium]
MDTEEESLDKIFKNLDERKLHTPFDKIDAKKYYPVYGDSSTISSEINSAGKLYVTLNSDQLDIIWGNYQINYHKNELVDFRRNLYGTNVDYDNKFSFDTYLYQPFSFHSQDELEVTGGILYYLNT